MNKTVILNLRSIGDNLTNEEVADHIRNLFHPRLVIDMRVADMPRAESAERVACVFPIGGEDYPIRVWPSNDSDKLKRFAVSVRAIDCLTPDAARAYALAILRAADIAERMEMNDGNP